MGNCLVVRKGGEITFEKKYHSAISSWQGLSYTFDGKYDYAIITCAISREGNRGYTAYANISNADSVIDCGTTYTTKNNESELSTHTYYVTGITSSTSVSVPQRSDNIALSIVAGGVIKRLKNLYHIFNAEVCYG